jgi:Zn-dependent peptidase ImmA (M78 family)/transcriptional regulator with XRE-family HTH domain
MLTLARESKGHTQTKLAELLATSQAEISKFETGVKVPTEEQVKRIAGCLLYPAEFFYLGDTVHSFGSGCVYHRKRESATESRLRSLLALINVRRIQITQLLKSVSLDSAFSFEVLDIDEFGGNPVDVARALRAIWKLPPGPVQNIVRTIENAGGIILRCDFETDKIDALSQWVPGVPPLFLANTRIPTDRLRWTLAHEIGHITMHRFPTDSMEKEADQFAAELLMPEKDIRPSLLEVSLPKLASLKPYWRVSMNALLKRAGDLGTIAPRTKSYLWMQMGQRGYRRTEPVPISPEEPSLLDRLLEMHCNELGYGPSELAKALHATVDEVLSEFLKKPFHSDNNRRLQLVR